MHKDTDLAGALIAQTCFKHVAQSAGQWVHTASSPPYVVGSSYGGNRVQLVPTLPLQANFSQVAKIVEIKPIGSDPKTNAVGIKLPVCLPSESQKAGFRFSSERDLMLL